MLWKRKTQSGPDPLTGPRAGQQEATPTLVEGFADGALDTVVSAFRAFGRYAFEITGSDPAAFNRVCEAWAEHLAVLGPHPDAPPHDAASRPTSRDWTGARLFFVKRRQQEAQFIADRLGDLREVVADLTERLAGALLTRNDGDQRVADQVDRLRRSLSLTSLDDVRAEISAVSDLLAALVEERRQELREQMVELDIKVAALSEELQEVKQESSLDSLTRVFNRGAFDRTARRLHRVSAVSAQASSMVIADLDNLKAINDRHGHLAGDDALRLFANCLVRNFPRRCDFIARYGGDEFVVILPQTPAQHTARLAQRFLDSIQHLSTTQEQRPYTVTASVGLAEMKRGEPLESWIERADRALYAAKAAGRNQLMVAE